MSSDASRPPPPLDPECGAVWRSLSDAFFGGGSPRIDAEALPALRAQAFPGRDGLLAGRRVTERTLRIPGPRGEIALSVFTAEGSAARAPGICWIHGGGMVMGDRYGAVEALDAAEAVGAVVVSVEYRLAPEHPAPAPADDCTAALRWLAAHAAELGLDSRQLVLGGASAGGGLAAAAALRLRDEGGPKLAGLLLCCPMLDDRMTTPSSQQLADAPLWTRASNAFGWRALLGERAGTEAVTPYEAPGRAEDLAGLPPTFVDVGSADLFRDEDVAFASRIWACGGDAELHVWPGGYHGFERFAPAAALSADAREARRRWLARTLAKAAV